MSTYTLERLEKDGPQYAMAMLLECIKSGEPFITYGDLGKELEHQLNINKIFPTQLGHVAGALMDKILKIAPNAPLINVLITRPTGIPGVGVGGYLANRYKNNRLRNWDKVPSKNKKEIIDRERKKVFKYKKWDEINAKLFGSSVRNKLKNRNYKNIKSTHYGGPAESKEHKNLKSWVAKNASSIGLRKSYGAGEEEARLLSGDEIDVLFSDIVSFRAVEVKSIRSSDDDFKRGIYQCVKYREIKKAEHAPYAIDVQSILVTERELPPELKDRARLLGVKFKCVSVNKINR